MSCDCHELDELDVPLDYPSKTYQDALDKVVAGAARQVHVERGRATLIASRIATGGKLGTYFGANASGTLIDVEGDINVAPETVDSAPTAVAALEYIVKSLVDEPEAVRVESDAHPGPERGGEAGGSPVLVPAAGGPVLADPRREAAVQHRHGVVSEVAEHPPETTCVNGALLVISDYQCIGANA